jgi:hypothetical protein
MLSKLEDGLNASAGLGAGLLSLTSLTSLTYLVGYVFFFVLSLELLLDMLDINFNKPKWKHKNQQEVSLLQIYFPELQQLPLLGGMYPGQKLLLILIAINIQGGDILLTVLLLPLLLRMAYHILHIVLLLLLFAVHALAVRPWRVLLRGDARKRDVQGLDFALVLDRFGFL